MKKSLICVLIAGLLLVGCGGKTAEEPTVITTCVAEESNITMNFTIESKKDKVVGMKAEAVMDLGTEFDEGQKDAAIENVKEIYKDLKGIEATVEFEGATAKLLLDFDLDNLEKLPQDLGGISGKDIKSQKIQDLTEEYEASGFKCSVE